MNVFDHLHPMLVHFPIACFIGACVFQTGYFVFKKESLRYSALWVYSLAVCVTPFAVLTGLAEADKHHLNHPVVNAHKNFAFFVLAVSLLSVPLLWQLYKKSGRMLNYVFAFFMVLIVAGIMLTAYNGGRLVYEYGIGIEQ